jgi:hypothetical protein
VTRGAAEIEEERFAALALGGPRRRGDRREHLQEVDERVEALAAVLGIGNRVAALRQRASLRHDLVAQDRVRDAERVAHRPRDGGAQLRVLRLPAEASDVAVDPLGAPGDAVVIAVVRVGPAQDLVVGNRRDQTETEERRGHAAPHHGSFGRRLATGRALRGPDAAGAEREIDPGSRRAVAGRPLDRDHPHGAVARSAGARPEVAFAAARAVEHRSEAGLRSLHPLEGGEAGAEALELVLREPG